MDTGTRRKLYTAVALLILLVVIIVIFSLRGREVLSTMLGLNLQHVLLAIIAFLCIQLAWAIKWYLLVSKRVPRARFPYVMLANMTGNFVNITTPSGRLAGEPVRAGAVARRYRARFSEVFAATMVDKMGLTVGMIIVLIPAMIYAYAKYDMPPLLKYFLFIFFVFWLVVGGVSFLVLKSMKRWRIDRMVNVAYLVTKFFKGTSPFDKKHVVERVKEGFSSFRESFKEMLKDPIMMSIDIFLAVLMYFLRIAAAYMFFMAVGFQVSVLTVAVAVHITFIVGLISQLPGMVGISETMMYGLYVAMGVSPGPAITVAILTQMNSYAFELGLGYLSTWAINFIGVQRKVIRPS
ncbi:MAG: lysylphosphatidylglycerol synthase transmembrane domain-containing protein [Candidatus Thermoplasmatota archaeon]|nr:lysylphosphatidylglycerol synthase transmembrane domain-containing protein [Candidatus Thermoplasmatota archaeon]